MCVSAGRWPANADASKPSRAANSARPWRETFSCSRGAITSFTWYGSGTGTSVHHSDCYSKSGPLEDALQPRSLTRVSSNLTPSRKSQAILNLKTLPKPYSSQSLVGALPAVRFCPALLSLSAWFCPLCKGCGHRYSPGGSADGKRINRVFLFRSHRFMEFGAIGFGLWSLKVSELVWPWLQA